MRLIRKTVEFDMDKNDSVKVIDVMSMYGNNVVNRKDERVFHVSIRIEPNDLQRCLDSILMLRGKGVTIRKLDVY